MSRGEEIGEVGPAGGLVEIGVGGGGRGARGKREETTGLLYFAGKSGTEWDEVFLCVSDGLGELRR